MIKQKRLYGIDLLRILTMFCVVILHIGIHGGVLAGANTSLLHFSSAWFLEILSYPAVDLFIIISGFVGFRGAKNFPNNKNIISLIITTLFYSVLLAVLFKLFLPFEIGTLTLLKQFLPLTANQYWFVTSFFLLFLLMPILNNFVFNTGEKALSTFILILFLIFSCYGTLASCFGDFLTLKNGYSALWFAFLYILGAYIKKIDLPKKLSNRFLIITAIISLLITLIIKCVFGYFAPSVFGKSLAFAGDILVSYLSPTIVLNAVCWLCLFAKLNINSKFVKVIQFITPSVFSVYLIHDNSLVREYLITGKFAFINEFNAIISFLLTLGFASIIFIISLNIDLIKRFIFNLLKIDLLIEKFQVYTNKALNFLYGKLNIK